MPAEHALLELRATERDGSRRDAAEREHRRTDASAAIAISAIAAATVLMSSSRRLATL